MFKKFLISLGIIAAIYALAFIKFNLAIANVKVNDIFVGIGLLALAFSFMSIKTGKKTASKPVKTQIQQNDIERLIKLLEQKEVSR